MLFIPRYFFLSLYFLLKDEEQEKLKYSDEDLKNISYSELTSLHNIFLELDLTTQSEDIEKDIERKKTNENSVYHQNDNDE